MGKRVDVSEHFEEKIANLASLQSFFFQSGFVIVEDVRRHMEKKKFAEQKSERKSEVEELEGFPSGNKHADSMSEKYHQGDCTFDDYFIRKLLNYFCDLVAFVLVLFSLDLRLQQMSFVMLFQLFFGLYISSKLYMEKINFFLSC